VLFCSFYYLAYPSIALQNAFGKNEDEAKIRGFIVVGRYSEQQIRAAMNLFTLCKWAKYVGASPVEPYVSESEFIFPSTLSQSDLSSSLRFRDYFNISYWNKLSSEYGAAKLVSWDTFLKLKPTKLIFVNIIVNNEYKKLSIYNNYDVLEESKCKYGYLSFIQKYNDDLNHIFKLKLVRSVCMTLYKTAMHISEFSKYIYDDFKASEVVVWIKHWKGISKYTKIKIYEQDFQITTDTFKMLVTSNRIMKDSKKYAEQVLKSHFDNYIAVSFRSARRARYLPKTQHIPFFQNCIKQLEKTISSITTNTSNHITFLAQDLGKFGDTIAGNYMSNDLMITVENILFHTVYNGTMNMTEWEKSFVKITGITDSGYIAAMQSELLKNSKCIIMFGGNSNFQRSVLYRYKQNHQNGNPCIYEVCYER